MKKFIILFLLMVCSMTLSVVAQTTLKYVRYGGNLDLIVKSHVKSYGLKTEKKTYGLRKDGVEVLPPVYSVNEVAFPADLFLLVFMNQQEKTVYIYSTESGEEVLHYVFPANKDGVCVFCGFVFRRIDVRRYELAACFEENGEPDYKPIMFFCRYRGVTSQQIP